MHCLLFEQNMYSSCWEGSCQKIELKYGFFFQIILIIIRSFNHKWRLKNTIYTAIDLIILFCISHHIQRDEKNKIDFLDLIGEYENCVDRSLSYGKELLNLQYDLKLVVQRTCGHLDALIEEFSERPPQKESIYLED